MTEATQWLLESDEPWTRYRTLVDLLDRPEDDAEVQAVRAEMLAHPQVQALVEQAFVAEHVVVDAQFFDDKWGERHFEWIRIFLSCQ